MEIQVHFFNWTNAEEFGSFNWSNPSAGVPPVPEFVEMGPYVFRYLYISEFTFHCDLSALIHIATLTPIS